MADVLVLEGLDVVLRALSKLDNATVQEAALLAGAEVVRARAEQLAPRLTGALAASIYTVTEHTTGYPQAAARSMALGDSSYSLAPEVRARKLEAKIASAAIYGLSIEYHSKRAFLRPALDTTQTQIAAAMEREVKGSDKVFE